MGAYQITRKHHALDDGFMVDGACYGWAMPRMAIFFADDGRRAVDKFAVLEAKQVCENCPVQVECLMYAMEADMQGVWGGTTTKERERIKRQRTRRRRKGLVIV